ncbi:MAG: DUF2784 domain-containing protein [Acidobacteriota bacterium]|jgi:hypothetical protein
MVFRMAAAGVVLLHLAFVLFVALGGLLALRWRRAAWVHLPALLWGTWVELVGWICPLTPLESWLRRRGGTAGYEEGFLEHYLLPILYPAHLGRGLQVALGLGVLLLNAAIYTWALRRRRRARRFDTRG